jgi:hypothetical protein
MNSQDLRDQTFIVASFTTVIGEKTINMGVFENMEILNEEFLKFKGAIFNSKLKNDDTNIQISSYIYNDKVKAYREFNVGKEIFLIVEPVRDKYNNIDFWPDEPIKNYIPKEGDWFLVNISDSDSYSIYVSYIRKNKFACVSESIMSIKKRKFDSFYAKKIERGY